MLFETLHLSTPSTPSRRENAPFCPLAGGLLSAGRCFCEEREDMFSPSGVDALCMSWRGSNMTKRGRRMGKQAAISMAPVSASVQITRSMEVPRFGQRVLYRERRAEARDD